MPKAKISYPAPSGGIRLDMNILDMPPECLVSATNMVYRMGRVRVRDGVSSLGSDIGSPARGMISYGASVGLSTIGSGGDALLVGCDNAWYKYNAGAWTGLTGVLGASDHTVFRIFPKSGTSYAVGLNSLASAASGGVNFPQKWDGAGAAISVVGGNPAKAKAMMILANRLLLFNLNQGGGSYSGVTSPCAFDVSAFNDFESGWSTTLNGLLIDTPGDIVAALEMGDLQGVIYKSDAIVMAVAQAAAAPFHFEWKCFGNVGPANPRCVAALQDGSHVFLGADGGLYRFDGVAPVSLGQHIQRAVLFYANQDRTKLASNAWIFYDRTRNEVWIIPKFGSIGASPIIVVSMANLSVWHFDYQVIANQVDITAGGLMQVPGSTIGQQVVLVSGATGKNWQENYVPTDNAGAIAVDWEHAFSDFGASGSSKTLNTVNSKFQQVLDEHSTTGAQTVSVRPYFSLGGDNALGGSTETITVNSTGGDGMAYKTDHRVTAQWFAPAYSASATKTFATEGCDVEVSIRGER